MRSILGRSAERAASLVLIAGGAMTMAAWKLDCRPFLTAFCEECVSMQFNTAVLFTILGFAMLWGAQGAHDSRPRYVRLFCGLVIASVGGLSLAQWLGAGPFGIDEALHEHQMTAYTTAPGRMAPNTALAFILVGAALGLQRWLPFLSAAMSSAALMIGVSAISGYQFGATALHTWGQTFTGMAMTTAILFVVGSAGMLFASARGLHHQRTGNDRHQAT